MAREADADTQRSYSQMGADAISDVSKKVKGVVYGAANVVLPWAHAFQIYDVNDDSFSNISRLNPAFARTLNEAIVKKADASLSDKEAKETVGTITADTDLIKKAWATVYESANFADKIADDDTSVPLGERSEEHTSELQSHA